MGHFSCRCFTCMTPAQAGRLVCGGCGGVLSFDYDAAALAADPARIGMWRWWRWLPVAENAEPVTLGEGATPLLRARTDLPLDLWIKDIHAGRIPEFGASLLH